MDFHFHKKFNLIRRPKKIQKSMICTRMFGNILSSKGFQLIFETFYYNDYSSVYLIQFNILPYEILKELQHLNIRSNTRNTKP